MLGLDGGVVTLEEEQEEVVVREEGVREWGVTAVPGVSKLMMFAAQCSHLPPPRSRVCDVARALIKAPGINRDRMTRVTASPSAIVASSRCGAG